MHSLIGRDSHIGSWLGQEKGSCPHTFFVCVSLFGPACFDFHNFGQFAARLSPVMFDVDSKCSILIWFWKDSQSSQDDRPGKGLYVLIPLLFVFSALDCLFGFSLFRAIYNKIRRRNVCFWFDMFDFDWILNRLSFKLGWQARKRAVSPHTFAVRVFLLWLACMDFFNFVPFETRSWNAMFDYESRCLILMGFYKTLRSY